MEEELRAENSRWIYWFTNSGIARIQTVSFTLLLGATVGIGALFTATLLIIASSAIGLSSEALLIAFVLGFGLITAFPVLAQEILRNRLLTIPLDRLLRRSGSIVIPWQEVRRARSKGGVITIWTSTKKYPIFARKNHWDIELFMRGKIGERLAFD